MKNKRYSNPDRISYLPNLLQTHIISFLSMEDAIRTTVLSKQWRNVCTSLSNLSFYQNYYEEITKNNKTDFKDFVYQTLLLHDGSDIESFRLCVRDGNKLLSHVISWCSFAVRHNVKDFELEVFDEMLEKVPYCLNACRSLHVLTLSRVNMDFGMILGFPLLRKLSLYSVYFVDDNKNTSTSNNNRRFDISCPMLEDLSLAFCSWNQFTVLMISACKLKTLVIYDEFVLSTIKITTPKLLDITYFGKPPEISSDTLSSLVNASFELHSFRLDYEETLSNALCERTSKILMGMQNVKRLILRHRFVDFLPAAQDLFACNHPSCFSMKHLRVDMSPTESDVQVITFLLGFCPNLQNLEIFIQDHIHQANVINIEEDTQPQMFCRGSMLRHLKTVGIWDFGGSECEMNLVRCLLENANMMEKMDIIFSTKLRDAVLTQASISEKIVAFTKISPTAIISFCDSW